MCGNGDQVNIQRHERPDAPIEVQQQGQGQVMSEAERLRIQEEQRLAEERKQATRDQQKRVQKNTYVVSKKEEANYERQVNIVAHKRDNVLQKNIRKAIVDNLGRDRYKAIDDIRIKKGNTKTKTVKLNHAAGSKLALEGGDVIEFNMAGSGYKYFRKDYKGVAGKHEEDEYRADPIKVRWYNKSKLLNFLGLTRSKKRIDELNANREEKNRQIESIYGKVVEEKVLGNKLNHLRKKESVNEAGATKIRYSFSGPNKSNFGKYSENKLERYILELAKQSLSKKFNDWQWLEDDELKEVKPVTIIIQGHSRGGVASGLGAMRIKRWIADNHPRFLDKVKFNLIQYDPVAGGIENYGSNEKIDHNPMDEALAKKGNDYMSLGEEANTTVFYSMHTGKIAAFTPQIVKNPRRIILSMSDHHIDLHQSDNSQEGETTRATYLAEKGGEVQAFRGTGIGELDDGIYLADDQRNLIRIRSLEEFDAVSAPLLEDTVMQWSRRSVIRKAVKTWFESHGEQMTQEELERAKEKEARGEVKKKEKPSKKIIIAEKTKAQKELESLETPKELAGALRERHKLEQMPHGTKEELHKYNETRKKYLAAQRSGNKAYIKRLYKQKGSFIDKPRRDYLETLADLSYYLERENGGLHEEGGLEKIASLLVKLRNHPCFGDIDRCMPAYLQKTLVAGSDRKIKELYSTYVEDESKKAKKAPNPPEQEEVKEEVKQEEIRHEEAGHQEENLEINDQEEMNLEQAQEEINNEDAKEEEIHEPSTDEKITSLFSELFKEFALNKDDEEEALYPDEIWHRIESTHSNDSVSFTSFRTGVSNVRDLFRRLKGGEGKNPPSTEEIMEAMARMSESANVYYDSHRGHRSKDEGKERRRACDRVREITKAFYDRLDIFMGGKGLGNIARKSSKKYTVDEGIKAGESMKKLVSELGNLKDRFKEIKGEEFDKIREKKWLFSAYADDIEAYKSTHAIKDWPKDIAECIRASQFYMMQDDVITRFEMKKDAPADPDISFNKDGFYQSDRVVDSILDKVGISFANRVLNDTKVKEGDSAERRIQKNTMLSVRNWIYTDAKSMLDRDQFLKKLTSMKASLQAAIERNEKSDLSKVPDKERFQSDIEKLRSTAQHLDKVIAAFSAGRLSYDTMRLWIDRALMKDRKLGRMLYNALELQSEGKKEKNEEYVNEVASGIYDYIKDLDEGMTFLQYKHEKKVYCRNEDREKIKNNRVIKSSEASGTISQDGIKNLIADKRNVKENGVLRDNSDFIHVMGKNATLGDILTRCYISAKPEFKSKAVKLMTEKLRKFNLQDYAHFKVSTTTDVCRVDDITIYFSKTADADAVKAFFEDYHKDAGSILAGGMDMSVLGTHHSDGIELAPEPVTTGMLNYFFGEEGDYSNLKMAKAYKENVGGKTDMSFSYTGLINDLFCKSAMLANFRLGKKQSDRINLKDEKTLRETRRIFRELCFLNAIDPRIMKDEDIKRF